MIVRRIFARLIDIGLPLAVTSFSYYVIVGPEVKEIINEEFGIKFQLLFLFFYMLTIFATLFTYKEGRTLGDVFMEIAPIDVKTRNFPGTKKIVIKELFVSLLLAGIILFPGGWIPFLFFHFPLGKTESVGNIRITHDFIFKLDTKKLTGNLTAGK